MKWEIDYADPDAMVSLQELMLQTKESKGLNFDQLGGGEGRTAREYLAPGYLESKVPLRPSSISALKSILLDLGLAQEDFARFHEKRLSEQDENTSNTQNQNPFQQNISFQGCDFRSANVISGNQQVNVSVKK